MTYTSESDTSTGTRGLVHLTENQRHLGLAVELDDTGLLHFVVQVVTLTGTLADTSEDGETTVGLGDVVLDGRISNVFPAAIGVYMRLPRTMSS